MRTLEEICVAADKAKYELQLLTTEQKNEALSLIARKLVENTQYLMEQNQLDYDACEADGMKPALLDRLKLTPERIEGMAEGVRQVIELADPIGEIMEERTLANGLEIKKVRVPMGVIGIIYESRPNVTLDAFALCFKAGSAVVLKGGKEAIHSNLAITSVIRDALVSCKINPDAIGLIEDNRREVTTQFMKMKQYVDVLIPRGSAGLIRAVVENSTIPVIETGSGNCHVYVDKSADIEMAINIIYNAKTQRIGVCNACESLVVHKDIKEQLLPALYQKLSEKNVEFRCDEDAFAVLPQATKASEEDFSTEYLDYILSVKTVSSVEEAVAHINANNTKHSESIVTEDETSAVTFLNGVDAACVYWNASTRFTDGFEFGLGAEIGISTQKLHARGPMGLREITSYKYQIFGDGQVRK